MDLHGRIMNILADANKAGTDDARLAYLHGHRDARHAAAQMASAQTAAAAALLAALEDVCNVMNALGDSSDRDVTPHIWQKHECQANLVAAEEAVAAWKATAPGERVLVVANV